MFLVIENVTKVEKCDALYVVRCKWLRECGG